MNALCASPLTDRQRQVLRIVADHFRDRGHAPTFRQIAEALGVSSVRTVHLHVTTLKERGYLTGEPRRRRALRLTGRGIEEGLLPPEAREGRPERPVLPEPSFLTAFRGLASACGVVAEVRYGITKAEDLCGARGGR